MISARRVLGRRTSWLVVALAIAMIVLRPALAAPPSGTVLYVGVAPDEPMTSEVIAVLDAAHALDGFELTLAYDPAIVSPGSVELGPLWSLQPSGAGSTPGSLSIAGVPNGSGCEKGATCRLLSVKWAGVGSGTSRIEVTALSLHDHGVALSDVNRVVGQVRVDSAAGQTPSSPNNDAGAPPAVIGGTTSGSEHVITTVPSNPGQATAPGSALQSDEGFGFIFVLIAIVVVVVTALAGALLIVAMARRSWRWSGERSRAPRPVAPGPQAPSGVAVRAGPEFEAAVSDYFEKVEAFGMVAGGADADRFLLDAAVSLPAVDVRDTENGDAADKRRRLPPLAEGMLDGMRTLDGQE